MSVGSVSVLETQSDSMFNQTYFTVPVPRGMENHTVYRKLTHQGLTVSVTVVSLFSFCCQAVMLPHFKYPEVHSQIAKGYSWAESQISSSANITQVMLAGP